MPTSSWVKSLKVLVVILLTVPILSGCWDRLELEQRAVVLAIALDKESLTGKKEETNTTHLSNKIPKDQNKMIHLTVQIAVPGRIPLGPAQGGGGGGGAQKSVWILNVTGHTIEDAVSNLQQKVSNQLFFGHLRVIIVSEELAKSGLQNINDYLRRSSEVRRAAWMVISKGRAEDLISLNPELQRVPALYLLSTLDNAVKMGKLPNDFLGVFWSAISSKGQEAYLPYVEIKNDKSISISGLAYFLGDHLAGTTTPLQIAYYMAIKSVNPGGYMVMVKVPGQTGYVMFRATSRHAKIEVNIKNGKPSVMVKEHLEGNLVEKTNNQVSLDNPKILKLINKGLSASAKKAHMSFIRETQKAGSDIFGFGEYIRAFHPQYWKKIRTEDKWREIYKDIPVDVQVSFDIRRVGMKAN